RAEAQSLRVALATLTPNERQAIETTFFGGLTHAEAAARLNQPLGTIKTRIRSGLHKLRRALAAGNQRVGTKGGAYLPQRLAVSVGKLPLFPRILACFRPEVRACLAPPHSDLFQNSMFASFCFANR